MSELSRQIEVDVWKANLRRNPDVSLASAKNFAAVAANHDKADPFIYDRVLSSLLNGASTPEDYIELVRKEPDRTDYELFNRVNVVRTGSVFGFNL